MTEQEQKSSPRITALDGLRGLAAMSVVGAHAMGALTLPPLADDLLRLPPLAILINGIGAVQLFFVLSGYCLSVSMQRGPRSGRVLQFYVRRIFRIQPPYVFGVLLAWVASYFYLDAAARTGLTLWIAYYGTVHLDGWQLLRAVAFPGPADGQMPVGWTIYIEAIYSLLMPVLLWIASRTHWTFLLVLSAALFLLDGPIASPKCYLLHFSLGIALHAQRERITALFAHMSSGKRAMLLVAGLVLLATPRILDRDFTKDGTVLFAVGAAVLVAAATHIPRFAALLSSRPVAFLGRVSYSLYLVHFTVLLLCVQLVRRPLSGWEIAGFVALVASLSCAVASLGYRTVELPAIRVGNRVCGWLARRTGTAFHASRITALD